MQAMLTSDGAPGNHVLPRHNDGRKPVLRLRESGGGDPVMEFLHHPVAVTGSLAPRQVEEVRHHLRPWRSKC
jgi:hypothetical protein